MNSRSAYSTAEDIVHLALERSVTGVIKENAQDRFYEAVSIVLNHYLYIYGHMTNPLMR